ncbi:DUF1700 domain-containing protein [Alkalihalobacillus sp. LMS6]|uniref:hypothetical protein n=1 Tax=Bacillaceae TaxID=186817 RepID=UPI000C06D56B|nr:MULTISPECIES: hypothetical protein [Bacillaceae]UTR06151.1 DUF1700 domain-containing protein [Alkalihalobacillus sp. LMS6]
MRINYFALAGVIAFNLIFVLGIAITLVSVLFALWVIIFSFALSPFLLAGSNLLGIQSFDAIQTVLSFVLLVLAIGLYPLTLKATIFMYGMFKTYIMYNKNAVIMR